MMQLYKAFSYVGVGLSCFILGFLCHSWVEEHMASSSQDNPLVDKVEDEYADVQMEQVDQLQMERGFIYTGGLRNKRRHGQGRMQTPRGTIYEGEWLSNQLLYGTMITDKLEYRGWFHDLTPHGYGKMIYSNGSVYRGMWKGGFKSGIGFFADSLGHRIFGHWVKGLIDERTMSELTDDQIYGIDLSHHKRVKDWGNMALMGTMEGWIHSETPQQAFRFHPVDFVFLKATEGASHRDRYYLNYMAKAKEYDKKRGSYHFMHLTSSTVEEQVENFLDYMVYEKGDLPPVLDIEVVHQAEMLGVQATRKKVLAWLQQVEQRLGVRPIIYTSVQMKRKFLNSPKFSRYETWIAYYRKEQPDVADYRIWQFTDKGYLYGNDIQVDVNLVKGDPTFRF